MQGDPLSFLLFVVAIGVLDMLMVRAKKEGLLRRLKVGTVEQTEEITHLLFVDNMLIF